MSFSDLVFLSSFEPTFINITNGFNEVLEITGGVAVRRADGSTVVLTFSDNDLDKLVVNSNIGTGQNDTFFSAISNYIKDLSDNTAPKVSEMEADDVIPDGTDPRVISFSLDLDSGILDLTINEIVPVDTFTSSSITIQGVDDSTTLADSTYRLTDDTEPVTTGFSRLLSIQLSATDLDAIKAAPLIATSKATTYLSIDDAAFEDVAGNSVRIIATEDALQVSNFTVDSSVPFLANYSLDMNIGQLILIFNETVDVSTIKYTEIQLQSDSNDNGALVFSLTDGINSQDFVTEVVINITSSDLTSLQLISGLATTKNNTYLSISSSLITDTSENSVDPVDSSNALNVGTFIPDVTPPLLDSFQLDLDSGVLNLTFNEVVNRTSFVPTLVSVVNSSNITSELTQFVTLTLSNSDFSNGKEIGIKFTIDDLNTLKNNTSVARDLENTYLYFEPGAITDAVGNSISETDPAIGVSNLIPDNAPPELLEFNMDVGQQKIQLVFNELVRTADFSVTFITITNDSSLPPSKSSFFRLTTNSYAIFPTESTINITIGLKDFNEISEKFDLATSKNNTFVYVDYGAGGRSGWQSHTSYCISSAFPCHHFHW